MASITDPSVLMLSVSGCRGIVGGSLSPTTITKFVGALATRLQRTRSQGQPMVVLARDGRMGGEAIEQLAAGALAMFGCRVTRVGIATTPTAGFMVNHLNADAGIVITASHNPGQWNGLKAIDHTGAAPDAASSDELIHAFHSTEPSLADASDIGTITSHDTAAQLHAERVISATRSLFGDIPASINDTSAIVDSVNCSGSKLSRPVLQALGVDAQFLSDDGSGLFPHDPEPIEHNLTDLAHAVRERNASIGFAQDPDADRLALVDEQGTFIGEEYTLALAAVAVLEAMGDAAKGKILVANLSTSRMIDDVAARFGARVIRSAVGEANVVAAMRQHGAILGGEGNGGVIWPDVVPIRDSGSAIALILALMARRNAALSQLVSEIPSYAISKRKLSLADRDAAAPTIDKLAQHFASARLDHQDGLRIDLDDDGAWLHVRPSNTEPILRLIAEAPSREVSEQILTIAEQIAAAPITH